MSRTVRVSAFLLSLVHAAVFGVGAFYLPWSSFSFFKGAAIAIACAHVAVILTSAVGTRSLVQALRVAAILGLGFLGYITYAGIGSGLYVQRLYGGIGDAVIAAAAAISCIAILFTVPFAAFAFASTRGVTTPQRRKIPVPAAIFLMIAAAFLLAAKGHAARAEPVLEDSPSIAATLAAATKDLAPATGPALPVTSVDPAQCAMPPAEAAVTLLVSLGNAEQARSLCLQADTLDEAAPLLRATLAARANTPVLVDVVLGVQAIPGDTGPFLGTVALRPGLDGVCRGRACLAPWQLVMRDAFTKFAATKTFQTSLGLSAPFVQRLLGFQDDDFRGLDRLETKSFAILANGAVVPLDRMREAPAPLTRATLKSGMRRSIQYVENAQEEDGRFRYLVDPLSGKVTFADFSVPRQAGTTLILCEANALSAKAAGVARKSLDMLADIERVVNDGGTADGVDGDMGGMVYPKGADRPIALGSTALSMVAFLACRPVVGNRFDALIARMGRALLAMQRADGGFHPSLDGKTGLARPGRDPLYAAGQSILALVLWEKAQGLTEAPPADVGTRIDRAMDFFAKDYWNIPLYDFFFLEENWHCLAAREALTQHRRDAYERFCLDYIDMKARLILDRDSGVAQDFVGAYGFGALFPPHHTATAGFGEAQAAAIAVMDARGDDASLQRARLKEVLAYLLRHQWTEKNCYACSEKLSVSGGFSENVASPTIRIDYTQHTLAAMFHGSQVVF